MGNTISKGGKMTATNRVAIQFCSPVAGDLYRVMGEDGELHCYDWAFQATTADGRTFVHRTHTVRGAVRNPEGFMCANYRARDQAAAFAERIEARRSIDPALWIETTGQRFDLEAELDAEVEREWYERNYGAVPAA